MSEISDEALMAALREISRQELDMGTLAHIRNIEKAGSHVSMFEVISTGAVLIIGHIAAKPSMRAIRYAYQHQLESARGLQ
jgi:hypothetical protein